MTCISPGRRWRWLSWRDSRATKNRRQWPRRQYSHFSRPPNWMRRTAPAACQSSPRRYAIELASRRLWRWQSIHCRERMRNCSPRPNSCVSSFTRQCRPDGSIHYTDGIADVPIQVDPAGMNEYPGLASLQAIMTGNRLYPAEWKIDVSRKALAYYRTTFQSNPHPLFAATLTPGCAELYFQAKANDAAAFVFEMNDLICRLQITANDPHVPQWAGGIRSMSNGQQTDQPSVPRRVFTCRASQMPPPCPSHSRP